MKKYATIWLATAIATIMSMPGYATTWLVDPSGYENGVNNPDWMKAEAIADFDKWASERSGAIAALPTETEKLRAAVQAVVDYFSYDESRLSAHEYYNIRDSKGVCGTYASALQAILNDLGMENYVADTAINGVQHASNIVRVDGTLYWADATNSDSIGGSYYQSRDMADWENYSLTGATMDNGGISIRGMTPEAFMEAYPNLVHHDIYINGNGNIGQIAAEDGGTGLINVNAPAGTVIIKNGRGEVVYVTESDYENYCSGNISIYELMEKYPALK